MTLKSPARYATDPDKSRGRLHTEPESPTRSPFQRDRDRIIHSAAFRRLKYKTQVFVYHEGDYFRTRLTHSLEVAQIARSICRSLGLCEDLAEAVALAHDLGHTPFGHAGEDALNEAMAEHGGFDHNEQTLRILTELECRYAEFDGLNLTWETLEGVIKHNGPLLTTKRRPRDWIAGYCQIHDLEIGTFAGPEAQIAALADDIAYTNHDLDDGLRAALFSLDDLTDLPLVGPLIRDVRDRYPGLQMARLVHEVIRRLINAMVEDLRAQFLQRITELDPADVSEVRQAERPVAVFSQEMGENVRDLRSFLFTRMYRHYRVNRMTSRARRVVSELFALLVSEPQCLPDEWQAIAAGPGEPATVRAVADYIAGMTDRYATEEHAKLFNPAYR